jgi:hypothetical protein
MANKTIKILTRGPLFEKFGVYGPILTAYDEKPEIILRMLMGGKKIVEVLPDGTEVALELSNYNTDNSGKVKGVVVEEVKAPVIEKPVQKQEERKPNFQNNNNNKFNNNNNKFNNQNKQQAPKEPVVETTAEVANETVAPTEEKKEI